ncbi:hypothetical protein NPIL_164321 [Nephila pilipes]|uniref:Uncharacterized protein n=1 Tax=Nephila pilipes TaxID=299642 RepID=A0A8X6TRY8_NEPPI|nr:hypothetical protein NPIL_164321 [Nephila pilipes]
MTFEFGSHSLNHRDQMLKMVKWLSAVACNITLLLFNELLTIDNVIPNSYRNKNLQLPFLYTQEHVGAEVKVTRVVANAIQIQSQYGVEKPSTIV